MGTTERRLALMKHLCKVRHATILQLSEKFNVSTRTIQRDIFELEFLMPLDIKPGRYVGGIYVKENYTMDRMYMSEEEITLLIKVKNISKDRLSDSELKSLNKIISGYKKP